MSHYFYFQLPPQVFAYFKEFGLPGFPVVTLPLKFGEGPSQPLPHLGGSQTLTTMMNMMKMNLRPGAKVAVMWGLAGGG